MGVMGVMGALGGRVYIFAHASYDSRMARKPFDPSLAAGGLFDDSSKVPSQISPTAESLSAKSPSIQPASINSSAVDSDEPKVLGVAALSQMIRSTLEGSIGTIRVTGEMSNFRAVQGHWYFALKDATARIDCMMFRSAADRSNCSPADGIAVIVTGQVTHYPPQGRTQLQCAKVELTGAGDLDAKYRQLCAELRSLGYFDDSAKRPIPAMPLCIALLTSAGSAAEADCLDAAAKTFPATKIIAVDIRVQGAQAANGIALAIAAVDAHATRLGIDAIVLVRGGGSREDLWAFNERVVADAIRNCVTPIVTGIGHESDTSIADLVADMRAATPSRAITEILPKREILREQLESSARRLARATRATLERASAKIDLAARCRGLVDPMTSLTMHRNVLTSRATALVHGLRHSASRRDQTLGAMMTRLASLHPANRLATAGALVTGACEALRRTGRIMLESAVNRVESASRTLEAIGPLAVLQRGYSITLNSDGSAIRSAQSLRIGQSIETVLADGQIRSVVDGLPPSSATPQSGAETSDGGSLDSTP